MNAKWVRFLYLACDFAGLLIPLILYCFNWSSVINPEAIPWIKWITCPDIYSVVLNTTLGLLIFYLAEEYENCGKTERLTHILNTAVEVFILTVLAIIAGKIFNLNFYSMVWAGRITLLFTAHFLFICSMRLCLDTFILSLKKKKKIRDYAVVIGNSRKVKELIKHFQKNTGIYTPQIIATFQFESSSENEFIEDLPVYPVSTLRNFILNNGISEVIIDYDRNMGTRLIELLRMLDGLNVKKSVIADELDIILGRAKLTTPTGYPLIEIPDIKIPHWYSIIKRIADVFISALVLLLCIPVFIIISILIKMDSPGPIFYTQTRVGRWGKTFKIIKFRTMVVGAERDKPVLSSPEDPRITRIGKILRNTHLDELPQFINVILGDMSIVGPRPERPYFVEKILYRYPYYSRVHKVRPGITSLGQALYGYASTIEEIISRSHYDVLYVNSIGPIIDIKIVFMTIMRIFKDVKSIFTRKSPQRSGLTVKQP